MRVLKIEPGKKPEAVEIGSGLEEMQQVVGGHIQVLYPFDDPVALVCNEEGKLLGLPFNRALRDDEGKVYDIISGVFFLCVAPPDSDRFAGLTDQQVKTYMERFDVPEMFLSVDGDLFVLPYL